MIYFTLFRLILSVSPKGFQHTARDRHHRGRRGHGPVVEPAQSTVGHYL